MMKKKVNIVVIIKEIFIVFGEKESEVYVKFIEQWELILTEIKKSFKNLQRFRVKDLIKPANLKIIANFLSKFH